MMHIYTLLYQIWEYLLLLRYTDTAALLFDAKSFRSTLYKDTQTYPTATTTASTPDDNAPYTLRIIYE